MQENIETAESFRFRNGVHALKMKDRLSVLVPTEPAGFQAHALRLALSLRLSHKHFLQMSEPFRKIGEKFGRDFTLIPSGTKNVCHQNPAWSLRTQRRFLTKSTRPRTRLLYRQSSRISSVKRFFTFIPAAP